MSQEGKSVILAHKIRLAPTSSDEAYFRQACGVSRFTYNWALDAWKKAYEAGEKPNGWMLKKRFNALRKAEFPWTYDVHRDCTARAFDNLQNAFQNFFRRLKVGEQPGYPKFKKKGRCRDSFRIANYLCRIEGKWLKVPRLGWVKMQESLRFSGKIMSATVSRTADYWFVAIAVDTEVITQSPKTKGVVGVDLGISVLATFSDGQKVQHSDKWKRLEQQIRRLQKSVSRKQKRSVNRQKAVIRLARKHYKLACLRNDVLHKTTTELVAGWNTIVVEDLNVQGMLKNHCLARAISRQGWNEFYRQISYKCVIHDRALIVADWFFPSTKTCSDCGTVKPIALSERRYKCDTCGLVIDRDLNAAINLSKLGAGGPDVKPVETVALASGSIAGETAVCEAGTDKVSESQNG